MRYGDVDDIAFGEERKGEEGASAQLLAELADQTVFPELLAAFWTLRLGDLQHPKESYEEAARTLLRRAAEIESSNAGEESARHKEVTNQDRLHLVSHSF